MIPATFHFLRPEWLLALIPAALLALLTWRRLGTGGAPWARLVDAHLLRHLSLAGRKRSRALPVTALLLGFVLASIAMAGPTWRKLPAPTLGRLDPTVVVLSLAQSMNASDQSPTRLGAARHKVEDILNRMRGGEVGLVIYADRPFVASPLTEDGRVVGQMLPELATDLMPVLDARPDIAIAQAVELLKGANAPAGRIVLIADGPGDAPDFTAQAAAAARRAGFEVSVIGVGTEAGSALRIFDGTVVRGRDGGALDTRMDKAGLERIATAGGGAFTPLTADSRDLDRVFDASGAGGKGLLEKTGLTADQWADMGPYLLLVLLVLAPLAFRRGWIAVLLLAALPVGSPRAAAAADLFSAQGWHDLWSTPDQQGAAALAQGQSKAAADLFQDPAWRASALYKAGDYQAAADAFADIPDADYNRGNALAHAGHLKEAAEAYETAIKKNPGNTDAVDNLRLVKALLEQPPQDPSKNQKGGQNGPGQDKNKDKNKDGKEKSKDQKDQKDKDKNQQGDDKKDKPGQDNKKPEDKKPDDKGKPDPAQPQPPADGDQKQPAPTPQPRPNGPPPQPKPPAQPEAPKPEKASPEEAKPPAPQPPPAKDANKPVNPPVAVAAEPKQAEQDQTKEQMLRMVPDDPAGLLRARIRSHYYMGAPPGIGGP